MLKLYKPRFPQLLALHELNMTRAVFRAGGPALEVLGTTTVDGRFGLILPRLDGSSLLQLVRGGAVTPDEAGKVLAALARALHEAAPPLEVPTLEQTLAGLARRSPERLPADILSALAVHLRQMPARQALCNADLHPGNVIVSAQGPRLIDWLGTVAAVPAFDLAMSQLIMTELVPHMAGDLKRTQDLNTALQHEYTARAGVTPAAWNDALAVHLPVARAFALLTGSFPVLRPQLLANVVASLVSDPAEPR
ncbi:aminoglycoside phosphotransferase family protein [Sandarakinorhabdus rubra]|uniref:aminoglycoside phosphotransferase family protein n=1 Tax=Sandarakinorhabdus rubra TaxID=2672568 RepID=UPI0013DB0211|nr:aminoglycoside phosphotransferase family protein [Sandarakinorhabdus rubra]